MRKRLTVLAVAALAAGAAFVLLTGAKPLPPEAMPDHAPDVVNGKVMYTVAGCHSCHKPPPGAERPDLPSGGTALVTPVGTFYPPNLTPDRDTGLGKWSVADFVNAVGLGISPEGEHLFPALPYTSYGRMKLSDLIDIKGYLDTLEPVASPERPPSLPFLILVRRGIGLWKRIGFHPEPIVPDPARSAQWSRGAYLVQGPGHCGECHTPRSIFMVSEQDRFLRGGPHPEGKGKVPSLVGLIGRKKYKDAADLDSALRFGEAFGYDNISSGGMGAVQGNLAKLPEADTRAIAEYLVNLTGGS